MEPVANLDHVGKHLNIDVYSTDLTKNGSFFMGSDAVYAAVNPHLHDDWTGIIVIPADEVEGFFATPVTERCVTGLLPTGSEPPPTT